MPGDISGGILIPNSIINTFGLSHSEKGRDGQHLMSRDEKVIQRSSECLSMHIFKQTTSFPG